MKLEKWEDIKDHFQDALILGNGASTAVHKGFNYKNLWKIADKQGNITIEIKLIAKRFDTGYNFELLLRKLWIATVVNKVFNINDSDIAKAYSDLRYALISAIRNIHCAYGDKINTLNQASSFLKNFKTIFSLNYDLLLYWEIMSINSKQNLHKFKDCFIPEEFDSDWKRLKHPYKQEKKSTIVLFPHGGLQFVQTKKGIDKKVIVSSTSSDILDKILGKWKGSSIIPLFISEGNSEKKMRSIQRSRYLSTIYHEALPSSGPTLVVYGWSMNEKVDGHILKQIRKGKYMKIAVSVHVPTTKNICKFIAETNNKLNPVENANITYFDATSNGCWIYPELSK